MPSACSRIEHLPGGAFAGAGSGGSTGPGHDWAVSESAIEGAAVLSSELVRVRAGSRRWMKRPGRGMRYIELELLEHPLVPRELVCLGIRMRLRA